MWSMNTHLNSILKPQNMKHHRRLSENQIQKYESNFLYNTYLFTYSVYLTVLIIALKDRKINSLQIL